MRHHKRNSSTPALFIFLLIIGGFILLRGVMSAVENLFTEHLGVVIALVALLAACGIAYAIYCFLNKKYEQFVRQHSIVVHSLEQINREFQFFDIETFDMRHDYDNENFYSDISPKDYLTYQLVYKQRDVKNAIKAAETNASKLEQYRQKVNAIKEVDIYDTENIPRFAKLRQRIEESVFRSLLKKPTTEFVIRVDILLTNIRGDFRDSKIKEFRKNEILDIINKLQRKNGDFYLDESIWQSICRVERGKVSNKMRFAIYERDGYRCRKCGRHTEDLEIDHIFPIAKGGKSNFENLQTLCHRCNALKSDHVEKGAENPRSKGLGDCPKCGAALVRKRGKYGDFAACPNYPNCQYTKNL